MVKRKGYKTDRTVLMENAIYDYFKKEHDVELLHERKISTGVIPDFCAQLKIGNEVVDVIIVEIKQAATDFYSGCGLNFVGSSNYLAVPTELVGFAIEFIRNHLFNEIGVLEVTKTGMVRTVIYPKEKESHYTSCHLPGWWLPYHLDTRARKRHTA